MHYQCSGNEDAEVRKIAQDCCDLAATIAEAETMFWDRLKAEGFTGEYSEAGASLAFVADDETEYAPSDLVRLMEAAGFGTQTDIAEALGVSQPTVSEWRRDRQAMTLPVRKLAWRLIADQS